MMKASCDFGKIRLICSDIDGTLLRKETEIPEYVKNEIWRLHRQGITFTFATGRLPYEVDHLFAGLPERTPYVAGNGAVIKCGDEILKEYYLIPSKLRDVAQKYNDLGMTIIFSYDDMERPLSVTPWSKSAVEMFPGLDTPADDDVWERKLQRMFFFHPEGKYMEECRRDLAVFCDDYDICSQNSKSIQIAPLGCTKSTGVQQLAQMLGIERDAVLCIGDAENDISMIRFAGIGVAVANGAEALKQIADYTTFEQFTQGVAEILKLCGQNCHN